MTAQDIATLAVKNAARADREGDRAERDRVIAEAWQSIGFSAPLDAQYILGGAEDDFRFNDDAARFWR